MPDEYPKISIVTPVFNQETYLEECILSILDQKYPNLEYIIIDGGSTDKTVDIIKKYSPYLAFWISEKDSGMYDAIQKGLKRTTGEIMGWLNSDDLLHKKSLFTVSQIFQHHLEIDWLQGYPTVVDEMSRVIYHRPQRFSRYSFYLKEYYDGIYIQQESTYWRRSLWDKAGAHVSTAYRYAGDLDLWMRFFPYSEPVSTNALIGAFRMSNAEQITQKHFEEYIAECDDIVDKAVKILPQDELSTIRKIKKGIEIRKKYPLISKLLSRYHPIFSKIKSPRSVNFDLQDKSFKMQ
jgi:glycosyltransferase involved in cell wall biosynthesis